MSAGTIRVEDGEFNVDVVDRWMSVDVRPHVAAAMSAALRDAIRAMTWREGTDSLKLVAAYARMALSLETDHAIRRIGTEDAAVLLSVQAIRTSEIGRWVTYRLATSPMRQSPASMDPVFSDRAGKRLEEAVLDVMDA